MIERFLKYLNDVGYSARLEGSYVRITLPSHVGAEEIDLAISEAELRNRVAATTAAEDLWPGVDPVEAEFRLILIHLEEAIGLRDYDGSTSTIAISENGTIEFR